MAKANEKTVFRSPGFLSLLTLLFIGLKLTGYIEWSWWLVLLPTWGPLAFFGSLFLVTFLGIMIAAALK